MRYATIGAVTISLAMSAGFAAAMDCPENLPTIEPGKLTMSINATLPPRQYIDASGELKGLHPDLGNEIAKRLCLEPVYTNVPFEVQKQTSQRKADKKPAAVR